MTDKPLAPLTSTERAEKILQIIKEHNPYLIASTLTRPQIAAEIDDAVKSAVEEAERKMLMTSISRGAEIRSEVYEDAAKIAETRLSGDGAARDIRAKAKEMK